MIVDRSGLTPPFVVGAVLLGLALGTPLALLAGRLLHGPRRLSWKVSVISSVVTGATFGLLTARFAAPLELVAYLVLAASAIVLAIVDFADKRLPNPVVLASAVAVTVLLLLAALQAGSLSAAIGVVAGGVGMFAFYFVLALISPRSMGMGDVKLAYVLGAATGYLSLTAWLAALLAGFLVGAVVSLIGLASRRIGLKSVIPFGPSMLVGAFLAVFMR